jgi:hypothetical protein
MCPTSPLARLTTLSLLCMLSILLAGCTGTGKDGAGSKHSGASKALRVLFKQARIFGDWTDDSSSASRMRQAGAAAFEFDIVHGGFGGVELPLGGKDLSGFGSINIIYLVTGGVARHVQLESVDGVRQNVSLAAYSRPWGDEPWLIARVPLEAFYLLGEAELESGISRIAFTVHGKGTLAFKDISMSVMVEDEEETVPQYVRSHSQPQPQGGPDDGRRGGQAKGHAIWVYDVDEHLADTIRDFNTASRTPIRYLFVRAGTVGARVKLETSALNYYAARLDDVLIFAMFEGTASALPTDPAAQLPLARTLALFDRNPKVAGVMLNVANFDATVRSLYEATTQALQKPVAGSYDRWDEENDLIACDLPVLRGYGIGTQPPAFGRTARAMYEGFAHAAGEVNRPFIVGAPFSATDREHAYVLLPDGRRSESGHTMEAFTEEAFVAIEPLRGNKRFVGIGMFAGRRPGTGGVDAGNRYYPRTISAENWQRLADFGY